MRKRSLDGDTRERVERLKALEAEHIANAGFAADATVPADVRERCHMAAVLKLTYEQMEARLLMGEFIDPAVMLKITETIVAVLPPRPPPKLRIEFVEPSAEHIAQGWRSAEMRLEAEVKELTERLNVAYRERDAARRDAAELRNALPVAVAPSQSPVDPSCRKSGSHRLPSQDAAPEPAREPASNVVPPKKTEMHGPGSYAVNLSLEQRYPHLRDTPPIGKW
jgi:hypothetical protein